tara:strand:+ start:585 stop:908 length:324 start_codon:yes stop_codon:yes gene_type:complete
MAFFGENNVGAWLNFNATNSNAVRDSFNVSSITDNNTGTFTANYTTSFGNDFYCAVISGGHSSNSSVPRGFETIYNYQNQSTKFDFRNESGQEVDPQVCCLIVVADQ